MFIDSFSIGIDDLPKDKAADRHLVLKMITDAGRYSCFEASANDTIADTMTALMKSDLVESYIPDHFKNRRDESGLRKPVYDTYPWTYVRLTDAGKAALGQKQK